MGKYGVGDKEMPKRNLIIYNNKYQLSEVRPYINKFINCADFLFVGEESNLDKCDFFIKNKFSLMQSIGALKSASILNKEKSLPEKYKYLILIGCQDIASDLVRRFFCSDFVIIVEDNMDFYYRRQTHDLKSYAAWIAYFLSWLLVAKKINIQFSTDGGRYLPCVNPRDGFVKTIGAITNAGKEVHIRKKLPFNNKYIFVNQPWYKDFGVSHLVQLKVMIDIMNRLNIEPSSVFLLLHPRDTYEFRSSARSVFPEAGAIDKFITYDLSERYLIGFTSTILFSSRGITAGNYFDISALNDIAGTKIQKKYREIIKEYMNYKVENDFNWL